MLLITFNRLIIKNYLTESLLIYSVDCMLITTNLLLIIIQLRFFSIIFKPSSSFLIAFDANNQCISRYFIDFQLLTNTSYISPYYLLLSLCCALLSVSPIIRKISLIWACYEIDMILLCPYNINQFVTNI